MDFTRTIQQDEDPERQERYFDGSYSSIWLALRGVPTKANVGDWVYLIHRGAIIGRCRIQSIEPTDEDLRVGSTQHKVEAKCKVYLECPGERAPCYIPRRGTTGIRYDEVPEWDTVG